jgi:hypothetical protein
MRRLAVLVATAAVATNSGAQTPLTIDTSFRFYYTPEVMNYWDSVISYWTPAVGFVHLRQNGEVMAVGGQIMPVEQIPWGYDRSVLLSTTGAALSFIEAGPLHYELPQTNQYFGSNKRFNYDGSLDFSWQMPAPVTWGFQLVNIGVSAWHFFDDVSALNGGYYRIADDPLKYVLVKTTPSGTRDSTFQMRHADHPLGPYGEYIHPLSNGQYLFNGRWTHYEGRPCGSVVRINSDGSQDTTFHFPSWQGTVAVIHEQQDGKVIMGGRIWMNDYADTLQLVRVNVDGSLDTTFNNFADYRNNGAGLYSSMACGVNVLEKLDEERFVVGGLFTTINGEPRGCIACVDTAGILLDCWAGGGLEPISYTPGGAPNVSLYGFKCLANGECYLYGGYQGFTDANGFHPEQVLMSRLYMPDVGVHDHAGPQPTVRVWPNPGTGSVQVAFNGHDSATARFYDLQGRLVLQSALGSGITSFDVSSLSQGIYTVVVVRSDGMRSATKWIKQ